MKWGNNMDETFVMVQDFPAYRVSNTGKVQSRWRRRASYVGFITDDIWKDLKSKPDTNGYPQVHLCDGYGKRKTCRIHDLVAAAFFGPKPKGLVVRHLNNNPANNRADNLAYGTYKENEDDKIENGTWNTRNGGAKITPAQVFEIRNKSGSGSSQKQLATEYGVSRPTITRIVNNSIWKTSKRVLIGCEFSGVVRRAFRALGCDAWSCDLLPSDDNSPYHIQADVLSILGNDWQLAIFHPPCTHLAVSGAAWFKYKVKEQAEALDFVRALMNAPIPMIAIENPVSVISSYIRKPDQIIQPYHFGHMERKTTCLWLKNLPALEHVTEWKEAVSRLPKNKQNPLHYLPPSEDRWKLRSTTYQGFADAMASQWGGHSDVLKKAA